MIARYHCHEFHLPPPHGLFDESRPLCCSRSRIRIRFCFRFFVVGQDVVRSAMQQCAFGDDDDDDDDDCPFGGGREDE